MDSVQNSGERKRAACARRILRLLPGLRLRVLAARSPGRAIVISIRRSSTSLRSWCGAMKIVFTIILASLLCCLVSPAQAQGHIAAQEVTIPSSSVADAQHTARAGYVGDQACESCHADQLASYHQTAHYLTSMAPGHETILGKFTAGDNVLKTANPNLYFRMDEHADGKEEGFFQTAVAGTPPHTNARSERIGVVVGSGEKGQTYLYWSDDQLFQLPVSWWRKNRLGEQPRLSRWLCGLRSCDHPALSRVSRNLFSVSAASGQSIQHCGRFTRHPVREVPRSGRANTLSARNRSRCTPGRRHPEPGAFHTRAADGPLCMVSCRARAGLATGIFISSRRSAG